MEKFGKYRGIVINNSDPEMRGRVLVSVPSISGSTEVGWAESCFPAGYFQIPRQGDTVWVEFEEGDIDRPVWCGIMPTRAYVRDYLFRAGNYDPKTVKIVSKEFEMSMEERRVVILDKNGSPMTILANK